MVTPVSFHRPVNDLQRYKTDQRRQVYLTRCPWAEYGVNRSVQRSCDEGRNAARKLLHARHEPAQYRVNQDNYTKAV
jgi:hypothetical protein